MFLRANSSENPAYRKLLESIRQRPVLVVAAPTTVSISAAATVGYAQLTGPLLRSFAWDSGAQGPSSLPAFPSRSVTQIVGLLGLLRAVSETLGTNSSATLQLSIVSEIKGKVFAHVLHLGPSTPLRGRAGTSLPEFRSRCVGCGP